MTNVNMDDGGDDNLTTDTFEDNPRKIPYKPVILAILLAILLLQLSYTVYRWLAGPAIPPAVALDITASPEGAEIFIDGKLAGDSRVHQELPPGGYEVSVALMGYEPRKEAITLTQPQTLHMELRPIPMDLRIQHGQPKAEIWFDEQPQENLGEGTIIRGIGAGMHTIRIKTSSQEINASFDFEPGMLPVPSLDTAGPRILFIAGLPGQTRLECNCTAQFNMNGGSQSLEPGKPLELALSEGEYGGGFREKGGNEKAIKFDVGTAPSATLWVLLPSARPAPVQRPPDTQTLLNNALTQIGNAKCDAADLTVAQILRTEPENADAVALRRRIERLRSLAGCQ